MIAEFADDMFAADYRIAIFATYDAVVRTDDKASCKDFVFFYRILGSVIVRIDGDFDRVALYSRVSSSWKKL